MDGYAVIQDVSALRSDKPSSERRRSRRW